MNHWRNACAPLMLVAFASPALLNCGALPNVAVPSGVSDLADAAAKAAEGCPASKALETGDFSALTIEGDADGQLKGFLEASYNVKKLSIDAETSLIAACAELGKALELDEAALKAEPANGEGARKVCGAASDKVKAMINASGGAKLAISISPPRCDVDVDQMLECYKGCGAAIDPGQLEASCEGGEISGKCDAECKGSCTVEAAAACKGTCDGTCTGKCDGKAMAKGGKCAGKCDGKCDAGCTMTGKAKCEGSCSGGCSVAVKAPQCSGTFRPPSVDFRCQVGCGSKSLEMLKCSAPKVGVVLEGKAKTDLTKLVAALETALPKIADIELGLGKRAQEQAKVVVGYGAKLPELAKATGAVGVLCITEGAGIAKTATTALQSTVDVSVSVKVSASASASTGG